MNLFDKGLKSSHMMKEDGQKYVINELEFRKNKLYQLYAIIVIKGTNEVNIIKGNA